jgi:ribitol-5-phosphate 2-dehydrogenase (NADP+) / D-ribitol-5-phosphate cytidylyltransferase
MSDKIVYALVLSGGSGNRFGMDMPKQFADVYGKTILDYCLSNFNSNPLVDKIVVVSNPEHIQRTRQIANGAKYSKVISVVEGGASRGESSFIGLSEIKRLEKDYTNTKVLIQDAVRPNTAKSIIGDVVEKLNAFDAVSVAVPTTDTIYISAEVGILGSIPERKNLYKAQTPQGFAFSKILSAYEKLEKVVRFKQTDDCSVYNIVFENENIAIVEGDVSNIKITFSEDLEYFRQILKIKR